MSSTTELLLPDRLSARSESIVPLKPISTTFDEPQGEFARLIPHSHNARLAFSQVVELVLRNPDEYAEVSQFIRFAKAGKEDQLSEVSEVSDRSRSAKEAPLPPREWKGYYLLDLNIPPARPKLGWILGSKVVDKLGKAADLLLTPRHGSNRVASRHLRLSVHPDSGCLMLNAGSRGVSVGAKPLRHEDMALTETTIITLGDLHYTFEYQRVDETTHRDGLKRFMQDKLDRSNVELSKTVSSLGTETDIHFKGYTIKGTFASGTSALVAGAIDNATGQFVAIKKMKNPGTRDPTIASERDTLAVVHKGSEHPHICHICEITTIGSIEETFIVYAPFLYADLYNMLLASPLADKARVTLAKQYIEGLVWIHQNGIMHRDLKPQNLGLKSVNPPGALIFDFGHATFEKSSTDHTKGTIWYLAPEVLALKCGTSHVAYDSAVDVWAMGLSLYQLICWGADWYGQQEVIVKRRVQSYCLSPMDGVIQQLQQSNLTKSAEAVQAMLQKDPGKRIKAKDALVSFSLEEGEVAAFEASRRPKLN